MTAWEIVIWGLIAAGVFLAGLGVLTEAVFKAVRGAILLSPRRSRHFPRRSQPTHTGMR